MSRGAGHGAARGARVRWAQIAGAVLCVALGAGGARAGVSNGAASGASSGDVLEQLARAVRARLADAAAAHVVVPVPPVPVALKWKPQKLGSLDLGAPLVAVAAADLDGDGKAELYAVTSREVIAIGFGGKLRELGRVAFTGDPAVPASRDVVGSAVIEGGALLAATSAWARELRVEWRGKQLIGRHGGTGLRLCGERAPLATGRNHFRDGKDALYGARCRDDLVDAAGAPLRIRAELGLTGALDVSVAKCAAGPAGSAEKLARCQAPVTYQLRDVGVAFEIADVDRDGTPDAVLSSASAPGDADAVRVIALNAASVKPLAKPTYKKPFNGGVAGVAVADGDGDGVAEVLAVVRLAGATRVDVWRLD